MLQIGLTGGIGSGKSTVARRLVARGAVLVDSDVLAREVVAAGTEGLAAIVDAFGEEVLGVDGELDRPRLASVVFGDADARRRLNSIVHPRVRDRSAALVADAAADAIVVQDVPLLVEGGMQAAFSLVVVVHADTEERVQRLVHDRGMAEADARSRIAAQADDDARRAAADVWLDTSGAPDDLDAAVDALWAGRLVPFEENLRRRQVAPAQPRWVPADPTWAAQAARLGARVSAAVGARAKAVVHVGPTAVPGLPAPDVLDLRVGVDGSADRTAMRTALEEAGFPLRHTDGDLPTDEGGPGQRHGTADPGRSVDVRVCALTSPDWLGALAARDWLRADPAARMEYLEIAKRSGGSIAITQWCDKVRPRVEAWAASRRWYPSLTTEVGRGPGSSVTEST